MRKDERVSKYFVTGSSKMLRGFKRVFDHFVDTNN